MAGPVWKQSCRRFWRELRRVSEESGISCSALCIGFILSNRAVSTVLAGCRTRKQLRENVQAVETGLPADLLDRLHEISAPIAALCGANCDLWQWEQPRLVTASACFFRFNP